MHYLYARLRFVIGLCTVLLAAGVTLSSTAAAALDDDAQLRLKFGELTSELQKNQFNRPLYLNSTETSTTIRGDIYAIMNHRFEDVNRTFNDPDRGPLNMCDVMMLHPNTKYCRVLNNNGVRTIESRIGKKSQQDVDDAHPMEFSYSRQISPRPGYFRVDLTAASGPFSTKDYQIVLRAISIDGNRTFLHLSYSLSYGFAARTAMKLYLATLGRSKVGFTPIGTDSGGKPRYIGGVRGVVERNTMRYYLAIDAHLAALSLPPDKRLEKSLSTWFDATEQYPQQLHELDKQDYIQMKIEEYRRTKTAG